MARLCIRIALNNHQTDKALDHLRTQVGDVVCIVDDDHQFSHAELSNGQYRIVDVPGVPQEKLIHLCEHAEDADGAMIRRRVRGVDLKTLPKFPEPSKEVADAAAIAIQLTNEAQVAIQAGEKQDADALLAQADEIAKQPGLAKYVDDVLAAVAVATVDKKVG